MSGIFKGDSIYKSGVGGGFNEGGELIDGDYIAVNNNTISTYTNDSRNELNFCFSEEDEVLNSVIEVTTAVNATVNVYVLKNGLYYIIGNVGGNTITYNNTYKINIIGDSFIIETVTPPLSNDPVATDIDGQIVGVVKIGNTYWTTSNIKTSLFNPVIFNNVYYYASFGTIDGWRLPNANEFNELVSIYGSYTDAVKSTSGWSGGGGNGTNASGLNFYPEGHIDSITGLPSDLGSEASFLYYDDYDNYNLMRIKFGSYYTIAGALASPVRLVKNA